MYYILYHTKFSIASSFVKKMTDSQVTSVQMKFIYGLNLCKIMILMQSFLAVKQWTYIVVFFCDLLKHFKSQIWYLISNFLSENNILRGVGSSNTLLFKSFMNRSQLSFHQICYFFKIHPTKNCTSCLPKIKFTTVQIITDPSRELLNLKPYILCTYLIQSCR